MLRKDYQVGWVGIAEPNLSHSSKDPMECYYILNYLDLGKGNDGPLQGSGGWVGAFMEKPTPEGADILSLNYPIRGQRDPRTHTLYFDTFVMSYKIYSHIKSILY